VSSLRTARPPIWLLMMATIASQLALTIYLPALPSIAAHFNVPYGTAQLTLSVYLFAFAFAQLAVGPLSDRIGRRPVLLGALVIFVGASVACALAVSIEMLIGARLVQACGACGGVVLGRAIVRDSRTPQEAPKAMGYMASGMALGPALAPLLGGQVLTLFDWRATFWLTALVGAVVLILTFLILGETAPLRRTASSWVRGLLEGFAIVVRSRRFVGLMIAATSASSAFNIFFSGGPILLINVMGVSAALFGWFTLAWAGNFVLGSLLQTRLHPHIKSINLIAVGQLVLVVGALGMVITALAGYVAPLALIIPLIVMGLGNGLNMPNAMANALAAVPAHHVGAASALMGFVQMLFAAALTVLMGYLPHETQFNIGLGIALVGLAGFAGWALLVRR
jgi:DHA1 family bicyclomycin/chloramphenicol resistance-like MFS transporter